MFDQLAMRTATLEDLVVQLQELRGAFDRLARHEPLVDLKAAAEHLHVSTRTLRRMVERDQVAYRRIGRTLRFNLALLGPLRRKATPEIQS